MCPLDGANANDIDFGRRDHFCAAAVDLRYTVSVGKFLCSPGRSSCHHVHDATVQPRRESTHSVEIDPVPVIPQRSGNATSSGCVMPSRILRGVESEGSEMVAFDAMGSCFELLGIRSA